MKRSSFFFLCGGCALISFNVAAVAAVLPQIKITFTASQAVAWVIPFYMIPYAFAALLYPLGARRCPVGLLLAMAVLAYGAACAVCAISNNMATLLIGRFLMGMTAAAAIPLGLIVIGRCCPYEQRGRCVGAFFTSSFISSIAGLVVSAVLPWRVLFVIPALMAVLTATGFVFEGSFRFVLDQPLSYGRLFSHHILRQVMAAIFVMSLLYHGVHKWLGLYLGDVHHWSQAKISLMFLMLSLSGAIGQICGGILSDHWGRSNACCLGWLVLGVGTLTLIASVVLPVILWMAVAAIGMGWTIAHNGMSTILTDLEHGVREAAAGLNSFVRFLSGGIGFLVSMPFVAVGYHLNFLLMGCVILLSYPWLRATVGGRLASR